MGTRLSELQPVLAYVAAHLDEDVSLAKLAERAGLSPFHLHRVFSAEVRETPKRLTLRLRLGRAAVLLLTSRATVLDVALDCGFQSHEAFIRAFRRRFAMTPSAYRERGFAGDVDAAQAREHGSLVGRIGPCVTLYHTGYRTGAEMSYTIQKLELAAQPVLTVRRTVKREEIAATIGGVLGLIFQYAQEHGIALAGHPLTRYVEAGPGMVTMEPSMRIVSGAAGSGGGEVRQDTLPAGPVAMTVHMGPYDTLQGAYAALEQWMHEQGLKASGAPWESYVTDPAETPNPQDWKTEVFWPLAK